MILDKIIDKSSIRIVLPWVLLFIALHVKYYEDGDVNAFSRYAAMRAMTMEQTFSIDNFKGWTMDWAQAPNGHYYSNKAPGPILIAYPYFWVVDQIKAITIAGFRDQGYLDKLTIGYEHKSGLPFLFQILPYCLLVLFSAKYLRESGAGNPAILFTTIALLFGNTAALFMSTWFGHGMAAWLTLSAYFALHHKRYRLSGLLIGAGILTDYSIALFLIPVLVHLIYQKEIGRRLFLQVGVGALLPGILWIWYHTVNFGHLLALPNMFQNPVFGSTLAGQFQLPSPYYMMVLLFGDQRGILYTQPWVLVVCVVIIHRLVYVKRSIMDHRLAFLSLVGLGLLLIMNSSFVGWHGGSSPGPRYLSAAFPFFAVLAGAFYRDFVPWERHLLWVSLAVSVIFGGLVYGTTILAHEYYTIWTWLLDVIFKQGGSPLRFITFLIMVTIVSAYTVNQLRMSTATVRS